MRKFWFFYSRKELAIDYLSAILKVMINLKSIIIAILSFLLIVPPFFSGGRNVYIEEICFILCGILVILFSFLDKNEKNFFSRKDFLPPFFLFGFLTFSLISLFFSISPYDSAIFWLKILSYSLLFYIVSQLKIKNSEFNFLIKGLFIAATILCLIGFYFYLNGSYSRLTSTFFWPNSFAGYLLLVLPLGIYWFIERRSRFLPGLFLILIFTAFILTGSRGAFLSFLVGLLFVFIFLAQEFKKNLVKLSRLIFLVVILIIIFSLFKTNNLAFLSREIGKNFLDQSSIIRLNYWQGAWQIFKSRPLLGSGLDTFRTIYPLYQKNVLSAGKYAHNWFLEILAETGIVSFLFFIFFLFSVFLFGFKMIKKKKDFQFYLPALLVSIFISAFHNLIDFDWHFPANSLIFWIFLGLIYRSSIENEVVYQENKITKIFFLLLAVLIILIGLIRIQSCYYFSLGKLQQENSQIFLAEKSYRKSLFLNPNPDYLRQLGIILYTEGFLSPKEKEQKFQAAITITQKAIKLDSFDSLNYQLLGRLNQVQGNFEGAEKNFRKAIQLDRLNRPIYWIDIISLLIEENRLEEAEEMIKQITDFYPKEVIENRKMMILEGQKITSGIEKDISQLYYFWAEIKLRENLINQAEEVLKQALEINPNNNLAKIKLGEIKNRAK